MRDLANVRLRRDQHAGPHWERNKLSSNQDFKTSDSVTMWLDVVIFNGQKIDLPVYWASEDVLVPKDQVGRVVRRGRGQVARDSHLKGGHLDNHYFFWYPSVFLQKEEKNNTRGASCTN